MLGLAFAQRFGKVALSQVIEHGRVPPGSDLVRQLSKEPNPRKTLKSFHSLIASVLLATPATGWSQLTVNAGDVFEFQFSSMQFQFTSNSFDPNLRSLSKLTFDISALQLADNVRFEMFANSTNDNPFVTQLLSDPLYIPHRQAGGGLVFLSSIMSPWSDLQGVIRFTGLAGSVAIDNINVGQSFPATASTYDQYGASIAVPEPASATLAVLSLLTVAGWRLAHRRQERL